MIITILLILFTFVTCSKNSDNSVKVDCIDEYSINLKSACYLIYAPVCGYDGETYTNDCVAKTNMAFFKLKMAIVTKFINYGMVC